VAKVFDLREFGKNFVWNLATQSDLALQYGHFL